MKKDSVFVKLLKLHTNIDEDFINTFLISLHLLKFKMPTLNFNFYNFYIS